MARFLQSEDGDAYIVGKTHNIRYVNYTGHPHSCLLTHAVIFRDGSVAGTTSCLEANRASDLSAVEEICVFGKIPHIRTHAPTSTAALRKILSAHKAKRIWSDHEMSVPVNGRRVRTKAKDILCAHRMCKDPTEAALIRAAARVGDAGGAVLETAVRPGSSEADVARKVDGAMQAAGAIQPSFPTIIAAGEHAAYPHHDSGPRKLRTGETVVCDFGALRDGYISDITRTVRVGNGSLNERQGDLYRAVLEAHKAQVRSVKLGRTFRSIDLIGREVIREYGYGAYFCHSTGHGIGLEVHEEPRVSPMSPHKVQRGMFFTIEPGAYVPGVGGARIEDDIWMGPDGPEVITRTSRAL